MAETPNSHADEIWKPVLGWELRYEVSNLGRVKSLARIETFQGRWGTCQREVKVRLLKPNFCTSYPSVCLRRSGWRENANIHRLVCEAFLGSPPTAKHQVAHFDGSRDNYKLTNLRWATPAENNADKKIHGTYTVGDAHSRTKLPDREVQRLRQFPRNHELATNLAKEYGMKPSYIRQIQDGKFR